MTAMMLVNISMDMPLPTPRSVISSPIHMMTAVPDTIVITMVRMVSGVGFGISGRNVGPQPLPENAAPVLADCTYTTAYSRPRPTETYLVYWVIFAWPALPSFRSASRRGITWVSIAAMMLAVMYGRMPIAKTVRCSSELPLSRFKIAKTPLELDMPEQ